MREMFLLSVCKPVLRQHPVPVIGITLNAGGLGLKHTRTVYFPWVWYFSECSSLFLYLYKQLMFN